MKNCTFREGDKVLQNLIKVNSIDKLELTNHFIKRSIIRHISIDYVKEMLLNEEPLGLLSSYENRFKVFYPSENKKFDLIVVIAIEDGKVVVLTAYEDNISKREGIK